MRARSIKPGICDNEILGTADPLYTLLFERLWMIADREGRLEDRPLRIKAQAFPYRDGLDVDPMLQWLADHGFIARYEVGGKRYIQVLKFSDHQRPHKNEQPSSIPAMDGAGTTKAVPEHNQGSAMDALTPSSLTPDSGPPDCTTRVVALDESKQCGQMSAALRDLGVNVTSFNPTLTQWVRDGFTIDRLREAVAVARKNPGKETGNLAPNYIDRILREPARPPPPKRLTKYERAMQELGDVGDQGFG